MDINQNRRQDLQEHLKQDHKLLKELEDMQRYTDDPLQQGKLDINISALRQKMRERELELQSLQAELVSDSGVKHHQLAQASIDTLTEQVLQLQSLLKISNKQIISLTELASFCAHTFPLMRWMHEPVPSEYVGWYFRKIQGFFMFEGIHIPQNPNRFWSLEIEYFFRCAYHLPSEDFQKSCDEIDHYNSSKLSSAYKGFSKILKKFGRKSFIYDLSSEELKPLSFSLLAILSDLRIAFYEVLRVDLNETEPVISSERHIIEFMIYTIDFLFDGNRARKSGKRLDLPEGIVLKLYDILTCTFQEYLGIILPRREDTDQLSDFPSYIYDLQRCWEDSF